MDDASSQALVSEIDQRPMASSLDIAAHFEKRHADVLRAIEQSLEYMLKLQQDTERKIAFSGEHSDFTFRVGEYRDPRGRTLRMYYLSRDAFSLLAMGFTGEKAFEWKMRYIAAFNAMEARLRAPIATDTRAFLAGAMHTLLEREKPERRKTVIRILDFAELDKSRSEIARVFGVSRHIVSRVLRRYAAYRAHDAYGLAFLGERMLEKLGGWLR